MSRYDFLIETYRTERLKTLSVWSQVPDARMTFRPEPRARTPHEHMVHQCVSEDTWVRTMLGITVSKPALPFEESKQSSGGLFQNQAQVVYRYTSIDELIERERKGGEWPPLPGPGEKSPTERP
jgi:hypothetical protein